jgi:hypothetical protein
LIIQVMDLAGLRSPAAVVAWGLVAGDLGSISIIVKRAVADIVNSFVLRIRAEGLPGERVSLLLFVYVGQSPNAAKRVVRARCPCRVGGLAPVRSAAAGQ